MKKVLAFVILLTLTFSLMACQVETDDKPLTDEEVNEKLDKMKDYGIDLFQKSDHLPLLRSNITSEQTSSYSRNGNNTDGFGMGGNETGEVSSISIRRPLLILNQPGVVYRMWFTSWGDVPNLRILVDSDTEITYRFSLGEMTSGQMEPFVKHLVFDKDESSGGFVSYVPIVFKEKIEIYGSGDFYYNINYQKYPHGTKLEYDTFDNGYDEAVKILSNAGKDPKFSNNDTKVDKSINLSSNETISLYETNDKQTITSLKLKLPNLGVHEFDRTIYDDQGYKMFSGSTITFEMNAKSAGEHVLKFRGILHEKWQKASVNAFGIKQGELSYRPRRVSGFEWKDDPFFKDETVTITVPNSGKFSVTINSLETIELFNARLLENGKESDQFDFGNKTQEDKRKYSSSGLVSTTSAKLEYDPNDLISKDVWTKIYQDEDLVNQIFLKITYKDQLEPAIEAPISAFFGFGQYGLFKTLGIMVGLDQDGWMYSYYPMPFEKGIKIELINRSNTNFKDIKTSVSYETNQFQEGSYGYFKANFIENIFDTPSQLRNGKPIELLKTTGEGHVVGITHSQSGSYFGLHSRYYLEGDEQIYIDGNLGHSFHGTGTEDLYNGGWYFKNGVQTNPLFGQSNHNYRNNRDRTVMIRTFLTDPIYFRSEIDFKLEHGGNNDRADSSVHILTYYYHKEESKLISTDSFNLGDELALTNHNYQMDASSLVKDYKQRNLTYEGLHLTKRTIYNQMAEVVEEASFEMFILKDNLGAILRREYLLEHINQSAQIYVDDKLVGLWQSPHRNALGFFVRQDDFYIPSEFTSGKDKIKITIKVVPNDDSDIWTHSYFEIFTIKN